MDHINQLVKQFNYRKRQNSSYSLRAFARDLGLNPSTLSKVLKRERDLPLSRVESVALRLNLDKTTSEKFFSSALRSKGLNGFQPTHSAATIKTLKSDLDFKVISEWEPLAILNLMRLKGFKSELPWICDRLGISIERGKTVLEHLLQAKMIEINSHGQLQRCHPKTSTSDDVLSLALKIRHQNDLRRARSHIWDTPIDKRDICSMVMPVNVKNIKKAKQLTRRYIQQMESLLETGDLTEVYQLSVQLFPITTNFKKTMEK